MPADTPSPLDTTTLVQVLKHQLGVEYVVLAGYLKVCAESLTSTKKALPSSCGASTWLQLYHSGHTIIPAITYRLLLAHVL